MSEEPAPMSAKMRRFMARPPKRLSPERIAARRTSAVRRSKPKGWLAELCEVQRWQCAYCNRHMRKKPGPMQATLDHMLPVSRGGRNQWTNLCAACLTCNQAKGSQTAEEYRAASGTLTEGGDVKQARLVSGAVTNEVRQTPNSPPSDLSTDKDG